VNGVHRDGGARPRRRAVRTTRPRLPRARERGFVRRAERYAIPIEAKSDDSFLRLEDSIVNAFKLGLVQMLPGILAKDITATTGGAEVLARQDPNVIGVLFTEMVVVKKQDQNMHPLDRIDSNDTVNAYVVAARARPPPRPPARAPAPAARRATPDA